MRAYTLTLLAHCTKSGDKLATDKEIIDWANRKLKSSGKSTLISSFQDPRLSDGRAVIDLIDAIKPGVIDYSIVRDAYTDPVSWAYSAIFEEGAFHIRKNTGSFFLHSELRNCPDQDGLGLQIKTEPP